MNIQDMQRFLVLIDFRKFDMPQHYSGQEVLQMDIMDNCKVILICKTTPGSCGDILTTLL